jgi:hypothetical protein
MQPVAAICSAPAEAGRSIVITTEGLDYIGQHR